MDTAINMSVETVQADTCAKYERIVPTIMRAVNEYLRTANTLVLRPPKRVTAEYVESVLRSGRILVYETPVTRTVYLSHRDANEIYKRAMGGGNPYGYTRFFSDLQWCTRIVTRNTVSSTGFTYFRLVLPRC